MEYVSVIIVNHNTAGLLLQCLSRVLESRLDHPVEVYVVDNASSDNSVALAGASFPNVNIISAKRNVGFAGGNNLALKQILAKVPSEANRKAARFCCSTPTASWRSIPSKKRLSSSTTIRKLERSAQNSSYATVSSISPAAGRFRLRPAPSTS